MAHPRDLIVQAVVALLVGANTAAGSRVYKTRIDPQKATALPALSVYGRNDPVDAAGSSEMEIAHVLELRITGWASGTDAVPADQATNDLASQVEISMRLDPTLGGLASDVIHIGTITEDLERDGHSSPAIGTVVLTYSVKYHIALDAT